MGIFISDASSKLPSTFVMGITEIRWNRCGSRLSDNGKCFVHCQVGRIALWCARHISDGLCQHDPRLRHSKTLHCLGCADCHGQGVRICISHIFRCTDHNSPGNKCHIFPGVQHFCQIVDRCVRIRPPHTFDKCGNVIIMAVAIFIILDHALLDTFGSHIQRDMDEPVCTAFCGKDSQFNGI